MRKPATDSIAVLCRAEAHRAEKSIDPESMSCATRSCQFGAMYGDSGRAASSLKAPRVSVSRAVRKLSYRRCRKASSPPLSAVAAISSTIPHRAPRPSLQSGRDCGRFAEEAPTAFIMFMNA